VSKCFKKFTHKKLKGKAKAPAKLAPWKGKSPFLTIQLWPQFGFGHRTPKPGISAFQVSKLFKFDHGAVLMGDFNFFFIYN